MPNLPNGLLYQVQQCLDKGYGRRRVAKELGITQWKARQLIDALSLSKDRPDKVQPQTVTKVVDSKIVPSDTANKGATQIRIVSSSNVDESSRPVTTRSVALKVMCVSDIHYPYEDVKSEQIALDFAKDYKPDIVVWNGDIFDFYAVSAYEKNIKKKLDIQEEIDYGSSRLAVWSKEVKATHYFRTGNHEDRLRRLASSLAPALTALRSLDIEKNIDFDALGFKFIPAHQDLLIGNLMFTHGNYVRKGSGGSVKAHFDQYGCSVIIGHVHRLGVVYKRNKLGTHVMIENGCLCDFDVEYANYPDWQHGFTTIEFDGPDFSVAQHAIVNHKLIANGKVYMS